MQLGVRGKNMEITNALRDYVEKKIGKLEKFIDQPLNAQVNMYTERGRHIVEVTAALNGLLLRGEEASGDMYASIDLVSEKLEKQLMKYKARFKKRGKENGISEFGEAPPDVEGTLVKHKRFAVKPLTIDEAIVQMNLLSHDFFVFANAETDKVNVLYRRKDGNYGLLEPEF
ncbi:MAG TPA: ribosome-associated translation inhibitor RaiA [Symbiobacteriaceae bacterium]|nr:ribosome-associated translation inhibitor RaiA [Symbiobacteriaceae bacterium]